MFVSAVRETPAEAWESFLSSSAPLAWNPDASWRHPSARTPGAVCRYLGSSTLRTVQGVAAHSGACCGGDNPASRSGPSIGLGPGAAVRFHR